VLAALTGTGARGGRWWVMRDSALKCDVRLIVATDPLDSLGQGLRRAFPLPKSGEFADLLLAIDDRDKQRRR
jgi:hypothetical protein